MIKDFQKTAIISGGDRISYSELLQRISLFSEVTPLFGKSTKLNSAEERGKVIIFSENRPGFIYAFFSVWYNNGIAVPVDAMSSVDELEYVISDCHPSAIWSSSARYETACGAVAKAGLEIPVLSVDYFESTEINKKSKCGEMDYEREQTALIIYTSGTTGNPKGVMLSFKNLLTNIKSVSEEVPIYTPERRALILLPLHHVLPLQGTMIAPLILGAGVAISPSLGAPDIMKTLQDGEVGLFIGVPRLWQSLYEGIMKKINGSVFTRALYFLCEKIDTPAFSRIVFHRIHTMMGGHLEACPSGGAALDPKIWKGLHTLGLEIIEGYGMTECAPIITFSRPGDLRPGCVGQALPSCQISIVDGEICAKGDNIMQGYYNKPEDTRSVIDSQGWLHTGDLGYLDKQGRLFITGRKKEMIVLSNGKNINPAEIESVLESYSEFVKEAAVIDVDNKLKAILCLQPHWAKKKSAKEQQRLIKQNVITPYNKHAASYKKINGIYIYDGVLPRTRMDKIQRYKLHDILQSCVDGTVESEAQALDERHSEEYKLIVEHIKIEKKTEVHPSDNLISDIGMDSLDLIDLECMIEQSFGFKITTTQIASIGTVQLLSEYVAAHRQKMEYTPFNLEKELLADSSKSGKPHMMISGWLISRDARWKMNLYFKTRLYGNFRIPERQQFILVSNHQSYLDALFIVQGFKRTQLSNTCFFAKEKHVNTPLRKLMAFTHGVIVMKPKDMKRSILKVGRALKSGSNLIIFPEGTRTDDGQLKEFRPTFAMLSLALGIPILPVCIKGAYEAMPKHHIFPKMRKVTVTYLPLVYPNDNETADDLVSRVHDSIDQCLNDGYPRFLLN